jgi:hypothetical protein
MLGFFKKIEDFLNYFFPGKWRFYLIWDVLRRLKDIFTEVEDFFLSIGGFYKQNEAF